MAAKADKSEIPTAFPLPKATKTVLGGVKVGDNLLVTVDGTLSAPLALEAIHQPADQDLNDYMTPGVYYFASNCAPANMPVGVNGFLMVLSDVDGRTKQIWFRQGTVDVNDYQTYIRLGQGGKIWSSWRRLLTDIDRITAGQKAGSNIAAYATSEGRDTIASDNYSHAEGFYTTAIGEGAHVGGKYTLTTKNVSFAHGWGAAAEGVESVAMGDRTLASSSDSLVIGRLNKDVANSKFIIGNGSGGNTNLIDFTPTDSVSYNNYGRQGATLKNLFRVDNAGSAYGVGAFNTSGADYAEYIKPWWDDNVDNEDRRGYFVTVKNGKLYKAEPSDYIVGITSGNPSVIGNSDEDWLGRWQRDEFNELIYQDVEVDDYEEQEDENGNLTAVKVGSHFEKQTVEVPEYDPTKEYIERKDRPEWSCVGMIGVLPLRDDGTCVAGGFAKCGTGGIATAADTWDCHKTFFVIERVSDHMISVEMR